MVAAIRYPKTVLRINFETMGRTELAMSRTYLPPLFNKGAVGSELHNAACLTSLPALFYGGSSCHALAAVTVRYKDTAVCCDDNVVRLIEMGAVVSSLPRNAQTH